MPRRRGGVIPLSERRVDDSVSRTAIINADHTAAINETELEEIGLGACRNYRNRIKKYIGFLFNEYPQEYQEGTRRLDEEEKADTLAFHYNNDRDLIYRGFNVEVFKAFLVSLKIKRTHPETGAATLMGPDELRKYKDAILWGSKRAYEYLPTNFYREMDTFLKSYRKETTKAKKDSRLDEGDADPINGTLFRLICDWALQEGNIFV